MKDECRTIIHCAVGDPKGVMSTTTCTQISLEEPPDAPVTSTDNPPPCKKRKGLAGILKHIEQENVVNDVLVRTK